jgi:hypothetical protein
MRDLDEGEVYLEHLRLEHRHLHQAIANTQEMLLEVLGEGAVNGRREVIVERLSDLRTQLAAHFAREEEGGYLEEAVIRVPRMTPELLRLEREHPSLLAELDELIRKAATIAPGKTMTGFREFQRRLTAHENAENRVMAEGFGCNCSDETGELE